MSQSSMPDNHQPLVTVIMPIRNEESAIRHSLGAALTQDYTGPLEILVADGMSDDATRVIISEISDERVQLIDNPDRIMAAGFNKALAESRGDVVIMMGGHTVMEPDYIRRCVEALERGTADCVGGPIETVCEDDNAAAIALAMSSPFGVGGVAFRTGVETEQFVDTVAFGAYTRDIIERAGPLDAELVRNQDDEYNYRLRKLGARILLVPTIRSRYSSRSSLRKLWKQYFDYGYWKVRVMQKHPQQMQPRQFAPGLFVGVLLVTALLTPFSKTARRIFTTTVAAYAAANLAASAIAVRDDKRELFPLMPPTFGTLHFSYGLGFLYGLVKFCDRWGGSEIQTSEQDASKR
jgi:glycosyltransferase involved in cell wall biosynthesis